MKIDLKKFIKKGVIKTWVTRRYLGLAVFNILLLLLVLLNSADYFKPYFPISINIIVMIALIASVFLLGAGSRSIFMVAIVFWFFAAFLRIVGINIWAERASIYVFEAVIIGIILIVKEEWKFRNFS